MTECINPLAEGEALAPLAAALIQCRTLTCLQVEVAMIGAVPDPDAIRTLATVVQCSSSLTAFKLGGFTFDAECAAILAAAVAHSRSLTDLQLQGCSIDDEHTETLTAAVEQSHSICKLNVSLNGIHSGGAASLARLLSSGRCTLTSLDVTRNAIGRDGALALAGALQTNRTLTELHISGQNNICKEGAAAVITAWRQNLHCRLRVLVLSGSAISRPAAAALAKAMQRSRTLEWLDIRQCSMDDKAMAAVAAGARHCPLLQHLDLSYNKFGAAGAVALAASIGSCPALTSLKVSGNKIGDAGMIALAPSWASLRSIGICGLTLQSAPSLAGLIGSSRALQTLNVGGKDFGAREVTMLAAALHPSSSLRTLRLQSASGIGADGAAALADALRRGWPASELCVSRDSTIGDSAALALAAALEQLGDRCTLTTLALDHCSVGLAGALTLVRAAKRISVLRTLDLDFNAAITAVSRLPLIAECGPRPQFEPSVSVHPSTSVYN